MIRVYDEAGNVIETLDHAGDYAEHPRVVDYGLTYDALRCDIQWISGTCEGWTL